MKRRMQTKLIHEGKYFAEVSVASGEDAVGLETLVKRD